MVSVDNSFNFNIVTFINLFIVVNAFCTLFLKKKTPEVPPWGHKDLLSPNFFFNYAFYIQFFNPSDMRERFNFIFFPTWKTDYGEPDLTLVPRFNHWAKQEINKILFLLRTYYARQEYFIYLTQICNNSAQVHYYYSHLQMKKLKLRNMCKAFKHKDGIHICVI